MGKIQTFTDLIAWKKAHELALKIYVMTKKFPSQEQFGLMSQMQRAVVSVGSNIAEGYGRGTAKEKVQFFMIARGSLNELLSQLYLARDLRYIADIPEAEIAELGKILSGLMRTATNRT